jgi:hypothetical protein
MGVGFSIYHASSDGATPFLIPRRNTILYTQFLDLKFVTSVRTIEGHMQKVVRLVGLLWPCVPKAIGTKRECTLRFPIRAFILLRNQQFYKSPTTQLLV